MFRMFRAQPPSEPLLPARPTDRSKESLSEGFRRMAGAKAADPAGKGVALAVIGVLTMGGVIWTFGRSGTIAQSVARREQAAAERAEADRLPQAPPAPPAGSEPPAPASRPAQPAPAGAPVSDLPPGIPGAPAPAVTGPASPQGEAVEVDLRDLVGRLASAPAERRADLRRTYAHLFALSTRDPLWPRWRRTILLEAARLAPDAVPEEAESFADLTRAAVQALDAADDAGAAALFLTSLRDRGGAESLAALERLVLDEMRSIELRVLVAPGLTPEAKARAAKALAGRPQTHPTLLRALR